MSLPIEDYALIGDLETAALVGKDGSIDWLCLPRFDSAACFANLLGSPEQGRWVIRPAEPVTAVSRSYRDGSLVLETRLDTETGSVMLLDFMPIRDGYPSIIRIVHGIDGTVAMRMEWVVRFDYGRTIPWVKRSGGKLRAVAGPNALELEADVRVRGEGMRSVADFEVSQGDTVPFVMTWHPSHLTPPDGTDLPNVEDTLKETERWWNDWSKACEYKGEHCDVMLHSLVVLKAMTYAPTSGLVAAPTTSLPEDMGGSRNWDYRYCWLRDATFILRAFLVGGFRGEAKGWLDWLLRAVAGSPADVQTLYGLAGERHLPEFELEWLDGYEHSKPVRIGNAAHLQLQTDVFGELMNLWHLARTAGIEIDSESWQVQKVLLRHLESVWKEPDNGIWEVRTERRHYTHSKVMCWVAFDRAVKSVEEFGLDGPVEKWRRLRDEVHREVCEKGYDAENNCFVQRYGSTALDASLLMIPLVGFLPADDPRMKGTVDAVRARLDRDGFILRYEPEKADDGLEGSEGAFLICTLWLADNLALQGRVDEASAIFRRVLAVANDVGLFSEEFDIQRKRMAGNFPQALTHVGLINTTHVLAQAAKGEPDLTLTE